MPIIQGEGGISVTGESIMDYRLLVLVHGLKAEIKGYRLTNKGRTCYSIIKSEYGFKGNKQRVLEQIQKVMDNMMEGYQQ